MSCKQLRGGVSNEKKVFIDEPGIKGMDDMWPNHCTGFGVCHW